MAKVLPDEDDISISRIPDGPIEPHIEVEFTLHNMGTQALDKTSQT